MRNFIHSFLFIFIFCSSAFSQITTNYNPPNNNPIHLVDNILLGGGIVASNHTYQGDSIQLGFFNGINSNLGLDSGVVMSTSSSRLNTWR